MISPANERLREVWGTTQDSLETAVGSAYSSWTRFQRAYVGPCLSSTTTCATRCGAGIRVCFGHKPDRRGRRSSRRGARTRGNSLLSRLPDDLSRGGGVGVGVSGASGDGDFGSRDSALGTDEFFNHGRRDSFNIFYDTYDSDEMFGRDELERLLNSQNEYSSEYDDEDDEDDEEDDSDGDDEQCYHDLTDNEADGNNEAPRIPLLQQTVPPRAPYTPHGVIFSQPQKESEMSTSGPKPSPSSSSKPTKRHRNRPNRDRRRHNRRHHHHDMAVEPPLQDQMIDMQPPHQRLLHESQSRITEFWKTVFPPKHSAPAHASSVSSAGGPGSILGTGAAAGTDDSQGVAPRASFWGWVWPQTHTASGPGGPENGTGTDDPQDDFEYHIVLGPQGPQRQNSRAQNRYSTTNSIWTRIFGHPSSQHSSATGSTSMASGLTGSARPKSAKARGKTRARAAQASFEAQQQRRGSWHRNGSWSQSDGGTQELLPTATRGRSSTKSSVQSSETYRSRRELLSDVESADAQMVSDNFASSLVYGSTSNPASTKSAEVLVDAPEDESKESTQLLVKIKDPPAVTGSSDKDELKKVQTNTATSYSERSIREKSESAKGSVSPLDSLEREDVIKPKTKTNDDDDGEEFGELVSAPTAGTPDASSGLL